MIDAKLKIPTINSFVKRKSMDLNGFTFDVV